jgi:membrane protein
MLSARFFRFFRYLNLVTLRKTFARAVQRRLMGLSAEMAYNAMLALFPAILAILTAVGLFEDSLQSTVRNLANQLSEVVPDEALATYS